MGWADWPARLQHLAPGPLVGDREVWLDGGHNPSPRARSRASQAPIRGRQAAAHHFRQPREQGSAGNARRRSRASPRDVHAVPIPDHACFAPDELAEIAASSASPPTRMTMSREALAAVPADARVLIFGSLYLAGAVLAANDQVPD